MSPEQGSPDNKNPTAKNPSGQSPQHVRAPSSPSRTSWVWQTMGETAHTVGRIFESIGEWVQKFYKAEPQPLTPSEVLTDAKSKAKNEVIDERFARHREGMLDNFAGQLENKKDANKATPPPRGR